MGQERICVAFASDERYAPGLAVAVRSLADHLADGSASVYVIDGGLSDRTKTRLLASWPAEIEVELVGMRGSAVAGLPLPRTPRTAHLNEWIYARLFAPDLVPGLDDRLLYLDADVLVLGDVSELWELDLGDAPLAAVRDGYIGSVGAATGLTHHRELGLEASLPYLNSGVLLMNLRRWRADRLSARVLAFVEEHRERVRLPEQDALNALVAGRWRPLDPSWNVLVGESRKDADDADEVVEEARILHFVGRSKPWEPSFPAGGYADLYGHYRRRTAWSEVAA